MGVTLESDCGQTHYMNGYVWGTVLELGKEFGWKPAGTVDEKNGCGPDDERLGYRSNDGQYVLPEDADSLANALSEALNHIPDYRDVPPVAIEAPSVRLPGMVVSVSPLTEQTDVLPPASRAPEQTLAEALDALVNWSPTKDNMTAVQFFSGHEHKRAVLNFSVFARKGGFSIW
jgi:hypothetical protein